jgi:hypothetical protein
MSRLLAVVVAVAGCGGPAFDVPPCASAQAQTLDGQPRNGPDYTAVRECCENPDGSFTPGCSTAGSDRARVERRTMDRLRPGSKAKT